MAIALRAARPGDAQPDEEFVADLYNELADRARAPQRPDVRALQVRRIRAALVAVAASVALVAGTATATEAFNACSSWSRERLGDCAAGPAAG